MGENALKATKCTFVKKIQQKKIENCQTKVISGFSLQLNLSSSHVRGAHTHMCTDMHTTTLILIHP